jgi:hypothetical protein
MSSTQIPLPGTTRAAIAALMVLNAILFWAASAVERTGNHPAAAVQIHTEGTAEGAPAEGAPAEAPEGSATKEAGETAAGQPESKIFGINLEASWVPYAVAVETVVIAAALILLGSPILFLVILLAIAGTVLDVRELVNQAAASRTGLSLLVAGVALTRLATAAAAFRALVLSRRQGKQ